MDAKLQKWADLLARDEIEIRASDATTMVAQGDANDGTYSYKGWASLPCREIPGMKLIEEN